MECLISLHQLTALIHEFDFVLVSVSGISGFLTLTSLSFRNPELKSGGGGGEPTRGSSLESTVRR